MVRFHFKNRTHESFQRVIRQLSGTDDVQFIRKPLDNLSDGDTIGCTLWGNFRFLNAPNGTEEFTEEELFQVQRLFAPVHETIFPNETIFMLPNRMIVCPSGYSLLHNLTSGEDSLMHQLGVNFEDEEYCIQFEYNGITFIL